MFKDPVCGMEVNEKKAIKLEKDGKVYFFSSSPVLYSMDMPLQPVEQSTQQSDSLLY